jgi:hypothetical protein
MVARPLALFLAVFLALGSTPGTFAQDYQATPGAGENLDPTVGEMVSIIGAEGGEIGQVTILNVTDPFEDYDTGYEPERGKRYVAVEMEIASTGNRPLPVNIFGLYLQDVEGFVTSPSYVPFADTSDLADLTAIPEVAPGESVSGTVFFQMLASSELASMLYQLEYDRMIMLADLQPETPGPEAGSAISLIGAEGNEIGTAAVDRVTDPFEDYDEFTSPEAGHRYVGIEYTIENTGRRPLPLNIGALSVQDSEGFLYAPAFVGRNEGAQPEDLLETDVYELAPGESISGVLFYSVLASAELAHVFYQSDWDRLVTLADLRMGYPQGTVGAGETSTRAEETPGTDTPVEDDEDETATDDGSLTGDVPDVPCDEFAAYYEELEALFSTMEELDLTDFETMYEEDPDAVIEQINESVDELLDAAEQAADIEPPAGLEDTHEKLIQGSEAMANFLTTLVDVLEEEGPEGLEALESDEAMATEFEAGFTALFEAGFTLAIIGENCGIEVNL